MRSLHNASSESAATPPPTVLVVADEVLVRLAVSEYLRECGYNVVEASERPDIRVVLTSGVARSAKAAGELCKEGPMLAKPYEHADLERRIRALLSSSGKS